jgi:thymidylate synthase
VHIHTRNVNTAFRELVSGIHEGRVSTDVRPSRYGEVVEVREPVTVTYSHPRERVLFNAARDVNPFALLYEALWMLAGRNDVAPLAYYTKRFAEFSDDGKTLNDAYGYRWRRAPVPASAGGVVFRNGGPDDVSDVDQIDLLVDHLQANPWSRRAVLQMWNVEDDLLRVNTSKAVCCNLSVLFAVEPGECRACEGTGQIVPWSEPEANTPGNVCPACKGNPYEVPRYLNMTVFNRSNDLVWGLLGANYVTFSVLQEYLAARLGLDVGAYHHVTNNLHAYTNNWRPEEWLPWATGNPRGCERHGTTYYENKVVKALVPLVQDPARFEEELPAFVEAFGSEEWRAPVRLTEFGYDLHRKTDQFTEPFLRDVAAPLLLAFRARKAPGSVAYVATCLANVKADDWRLAATLWVERRVRKHAASK